MNYRHAYHAGNFADVIKHVVLMMIVDHLKQKDKPFFVLDAFAGIGAYDLADERAQKTREFEMGVQKIWDNVFENPDIAAYQSMLRRLNPQNTLRHYPGSPVICAEMLRPHDRMIANELHPDDHAVLKQSMRGYSHARTTAMDAYAAIKGALPPVERRGLILIDPPFEKKDEFDLLARAMVQWQKRWPTGIYMIWYPVKKHLPTELPLMAALDGGWSDILRAEFHIRDPKTPDALTGTGLLILNAPWQIDRRIDAIFKALLPHLGTEAGAGYDIDIMNAR